MALSDSTSTDRHGRQVKPVSDHARTLVPALSPESWGRAAKGSGPFSSCPYSRTSWKKVEFSEVRGSKRPMICSGKYSTTAWRHRFGFETRRLGTFRCTFVYQGVATRNGATTREIPAHRTGVQPNFASTEFSEVRMLRGLSLTAFACGVCGGVDWSLRLRDSEQRENHYRGSS
jgi:hypothetical protein